MWGVARVDADDDAEWRKSVKRLSQIIHKSLRGGKRERHPLVVDLRLSDFDILLRHFAGFREMQDTDN